MGCYHFHLNQLSREGQSAVPVLLTEPVQNGMYVLWRSGSYTRKAVWYWRRSIFPSRLRRFKDRETLWNEVEWIEGNKLASAHSFDIALMSFSMEENIELARSS